MCILNVTANSYGSGLEREGPGTVMDQGWGQLWIRAGDRSHSCMACFYLERGLIWCCSCPPVIQSFMCFQEKYR